MPGHVPAREVTALEGPAEPADLSGLEVARLTVTDSSGRLLLADVGFSLAPGTVLGVLGDASAGKSLLLHALAAPLDLSGLRVQGSVRQRGADLWGRSAEGRRLPAVLVPDAPLILPASGAQNLTCFREDLTDQGRGLIEALTFSSDEAQAICAAPDALLLSGGQRKILALARAFLMAPDLYLLDRPDDQLSERAVAAVAARLRQETRLGRSFVIVTTNRALLDACDRFMVLQEGRVVDFGAAAEIRAKMSSGWSRFVGGRGLETEENLIRWVRAQFKRPGDETNRRNLGTVASELLAFSCQTNERPDRRDVTFEFKHFEGHGLLRMIDDSGPLTTGLIARARKEAGDDTGLRRLSPLAAVIRGSLEISGTVESDRRVVVVKIATYDPRKSPPPMPEGPRDRS
jgi:ABC-type glutathione transport system ATPase component